MADIASTAGVSRSTVSAVLNGNRARVGISLETAARIEQVALEMGYRRNALARAMKTGVTQVVAAIVSSMSREWVGRILEGFSEVAEQNGYLMKVLSPHGRRTGEEMLDACLEQRVDGVFCCDHNPDPSGMAYFQTEADRANVPLVCVNCPPELSRLRVDSDDRQGVSLAVQHLIELGHQRIAFIGGSMRTGTTRTRLDAFRRVLEAHGLRSDAIETGLDWGPEEADKAVRAAMSRDARPTALVCANDEIAGAAVRTARRLGVRVPEDVSITGYSDLDFARLIDPPLTTVAQHHMEIGRRAMRMILARREHMVSTSVDIGPRVTPPDQETHLLPCELIVRRSTAPFVS